MSALEIDRRPLFPACDLRLRGLRRVRTGPLFDVFHAIFDGRYLALKRRAATAAWQAPIASRWHVYNRTTSFIGNQFGWNEREPAPDGSYFDRLLDAEHAVLAHVAPHWNHPGAALARWCDGDVLAPPLEAPGALCLVMPWCSGQPFASLRTTTQRPLFPILLPALWHALAERPHGDLAPTSLMLESGGFRLIDPGVRIDGPHKSHSPYFTLDSSLLTTNAAHYPIVMPDHGPGRPRLHAIPGSLERSIDLSAHLSFERMLQYPDYLKTPPPPPPPVPTPSAADVIACGAIYFAILSGGSLGALLGLDAPLWVGLGGEVHRDVLDRQQQRIDRCLAALAGGAIRRALRTAGATPAEISLCERLVLLDLDGAELDGYAAEITRAPP